MEIIGRARRWSRERPPWVPDGALAALLAISQLVLLWSVDPGSPGAEDLVGPGVPGVVSVALTLLTTLPIAYRRIRPDIVLALVGLGMVAAAVLGVPSPGLGLVVALYSYAAHTSKDDALVVPLVFGGFTMLSLIVAGDMAFLPINLVIFATAWILGDRQRVLRLRSAELERRAAALERARAVTVQLATAKERERICGDLHDVVAHGVTAMLTQASGARRVLAEDPTRAASALLDAEQAGRASLAELRRLVGLLRTEDAPPRAHVGAADAGTGTGGGDDDGDAGAPRSLRRLPEEVGIAGYDGPTALGFALILVAAVPLLWRRRFPLPVLGATTAVGLLAFLMPVAPPLAPLVALYTVATRASATGFSRPTGGSGTG